MQKNKIIIILLLMLLVLGNFNTIVFAKDIKVANSIPYDPISSPRTYKPGPVGNVVELEKKAGSILGVVNVIGVIMSVITLMIVGIKYMLGSVEEKAEYKKTMMIYIIGAALVFSVTTIPNILYIIGTSI